MNPNTVTVIVAAAAFIISIFGASWLTGQQLTRRIDDLEKHLDAKFDAKFETLQRTMDARFETVNARLDGLDRRLTSLESRLDRLESVIFKPALPN